MRHIGIVTALRGPAHFAVNLAIKLGQLPKLDGTTACVDCGQPAKVYDHREYAKPLEVVPLCRSCNFRRGPAKELIPHIKKRWNIGYYARRRRLA